MTNYDAVQNYFEPLVYECIAAFTADGELEHGDDFLEDVACLALNRLPPRYVRYRVDAAFYMTTEERNEIDRLVNDAVTEAFRYVAAHRERDEALAAG